MRSAATPAGTLHSSLAKLWLAAQAGQTDLVRSGGQRIQAMRSSDRG
jgi:hypothetical protein